MIHEPLQVLSAPGGILIKMQGEELAVPMVSVADRELDFLSTLLQRLQLAQIERRKSISIGEGEVAMLKAAIAAQVRCVSTVLDVAWRSQEAEILARLREFDEEQMRRSRIRVYNAVQDSLLEMWSNYAQRGKTLEERAYLNILNAKHSPWRSRSLTAI